MAKESTTSAKDKKAKEPKKPGKFVGKIKETFGLTIPYWTDSLKKCISNL